MNLDVCLENTDVGKKFTVANHTSDVVSPFPYIRHPVSGIRIRHPGPASGWCVSICTDISCYLP